MCGEGVVDDAGELVAGEADVGGSEVRGLRQMRKSPKSMEVVKVRGPAWRSVKVMGVWSGMRKR